MKWQQIAGATAGNALEFYVFLTYAFLLRRVAGACVVGANCMALFGLGDVENAETLLRKLLQEDVNLAEAADLLAHIENTASSPFAAKGALEQSVKMKSAHG